MLEPEIFPRNGRAVADGHGVECAQTPAGPQNAGPVFTGEAAAGSSLYAEEKYAGPPAVFEGEFVAEEPAGEADPAPRPAPPPAKTRAGRFHTDWVVPYVPAGGAGPPALDGFLKLFVALRYAALGFSLVFTVLFIFMGLFPLMPLTSFAGMTLGGLMLFFIHRRDIRFRWWYRGYVVVECIQALLIAAFWVIVCVDTMYDIPFDWELFWVLIAMGLLLVLAMAVWLAQEIAWWVYLQRSARVADTFRLPEK